MIYKIALYLVDLYSSILLSKSDPVGFNMCLTGNVRIVEECGMSQKIWIELVAFSFGFGKHNPLDIGKVQIFISLAPFSFSFWFSSVLKVVCSDYLVKYKMYETCISNYN